MHRRIEIDWALSNMMPKAVPVAPLGLLARQCHADADVEAAATIVAPINIAMRKRFMTAAFIDCNTPALSGFHTYGFSSEQNT
jgi:hypothetical protein